MAKALTKKAHDREAIDVIYDLEEKIYKSVSVKYNLKSGTAFVDEISPVTPVIAVAIMRNNIKFDKKIQDAVNFEKNRLNKEETKKQLPSDDDEL